MGKGLNKFFHWISVKKYCDQIPHNYIEEELNRRRKLPWVVKRTVLIKNPQEEKKEPIKFIELKDPGEYEYAFHNISPTSEEYPRLEEVTREGIDLNDYPMADYIDVTENSSHDTEETSSENFYHAGVVEPETITVQNLHDKTEELPDDLSQLYSERDIRNNRIYHIEGETRGDDISEQAETPSSTISRAQEMEKKGQGRQNSMEEKNLTALPAEETPDYGDDKVFALL